MQYILRIIATAIWLLTLLCGAVSGGNFVGVAANTPPEFLEAAELARIKSAEYWTGQRLPDWPEPVPIYWTETRDRTSGDATFRTVGKQVTGISRLTLKGPRTSVLRDVIPHEVDHLVRATIIGRKIPRVLDEGAACLFERGNDSAEYVESLVRKADTVTLWNDIDTQAYPEDDDLAPFYGFSVSLTEFLLKRHGKTKLLELMKGTPSARWEHVLGEPLDETQQVWSAHFRGQIRKPVIRMFSLPWCGPCKEFWGDYLSRSHSLPYVVVKEPPPLIGGPQGVPAFVAPNGARAIGYSRGWQNWDRWARSQIGNQASQWEPTTPQPYQRDGPAIAAQPQTELPQTSGTEELKGAPERTVTPAAPPKNDSTESIGSETAGTTTSEATAGGVDQPSADRSKVDKAISLVDAVVSNPWASAAITGATGGTGAAGLAVWQILMARRRRKREQPYGGHNAGAQAPNVPSEPYRSEDIRPQQPTITNNIPATAPALNWVNTDDGFYARAHDEARRQIGRRYPGAQEVLEAELSLVQQFLSGMRPIPSTAPAQGAP
jgi:hypothetical protein